MKTLHLITAHAFAPWLLILTVQSVQALLKMNAFDTIHVWIIAHERERDKFNQNATPFAFPAVVQVRFQYFSSDSPPKEWHGEALDAALNRIVICRDASLLILDSDLLIMPSCECLSDGETYFSEFRPMTLIDSTASRIPHPSLILIPPQFVESFVSLARKLSMKRRRSHIIGIDDNGQRYGADTCDLVMKLFLETIISRGCVPISFPADTWHFNGCTEVFRKIPELLVSRNYSLIETTLRTLDERAWHDSVPYYYSNALITNLAICYWSGRHPFGSPEIWHYYIERHKNSDAFQHIMALLDMGALCSSGRATIEGPRTRNTGEQDAAGNRWGDGVSLDSRAL